MFEHVVWHAPQWSVSDCSSTQVPPPQQVSVTEQVLPVQQASPAPPQVAALSGLAALSNPESLQAEPPHIRPPLLGVEHPGARVSVKAQAPTASAHLIPREPNAPP